MFAKTIVRFSKNNSKERGIFLCDINVLLMIHYSTENLVILLLDTIRKITNRKK